MIPRPILFPFFFFNDTATTEIYTLSLHDALPISLSAAERIRKIRGSWRLCVANRFASISIIISELFYGVHMSKPKVLDRKSTRLNSSHTVISYAVFCLKKKKHDPTLTTDSTCRSL